MRATLHRGWRISLWLSLFYKQDFIHNWEEGAAMVQILVGEELPSLWGLNRDESVLRRMVWRGKGCDASSWLQQPYKIWLEI